LIQTDPQLLGSLDGLPASVRDRANRALLAQRIDLLMQRVTQGRASQGERDELKVDLRLRGLLTNGMYLLGFDPQHQHVIVAVGNPDQATNTAIFVPGVGSTWASVPGNIGSVRSLQHQAQQDAPGATVSTILWIGYDAPPGPQNALSADRAIAGVRPLDAFITGLHAAHQGPPTDLTLVGHSYGSLVVGEAASGAPHPLPVNNIVFVGSPGTGVQNVAGLDLPPSAKVYAGTHPLDFARAASDAPKLPISLLHGGEVQGFFGADPTDPQYGAVPLSTGGTLSGGGPQGYFHDYLDPAMDPVSFNNIALITAGLGPSTG
jgi:pimeloyl-ACP methyl ester carboxylesterase